MGRANNEATVATLKIDNRGCIKNEVFKYTQKVQMMNI